MPQRRCNVNMFALFAWCLLTSKLRTRLVEFGGGGGGGGGGKKRKRRKANLLGWAPHLLFELVPPPGTQVIYCWVIWQRCTPTPHQMTSMSGRTTEENLPFLCLLSAWKTVLVTSPLQTPEFHFHMNNFNWILKLIEILNDVERSWPWREKLIGCKIGGHESLLRMRLFSTFQFSNEKMGLHRPQNEEQLQPGGQVVSSRNWKSCWFGSVLLPLLSFWCGLISTSYGLLSTRNLFSAFKVPGFLPKNVPKVWIRLPASVPTSCECTLLGRLSPIEAPEYRGEQLVCCCVE